RFSEHRNRDEGGGNHQSWPAPHCKVSCDTLHISTEDDPLQCLVQLSRNNFSKTAARQYGFGPFDTLPHLLAQRLNLGWRQLSHPWFTVVRHGRAPLWPAAARASASLRASWKAPMRSVSSLLTSAHIRLTCAGL